MCIRDSDNSAAAGSGAGSAWEQTTAYAAELVDALGVPIRRQREVTAVSYTHLRAHETVLDLVCRLLLEKKKIEKKKK